MDYKRQVEERRIKRVIEKLQRNRFEAVYAADRDEARAIALSYVPEGATVSVGGSSTLRECGIIDALERGNYNYLDRYEKGLTPEEVNEVFLKAIRGDCYLLSANAVTETGELFNIDGNSNRVAPLAFGPKTVVVVAGYNKIVPDLEMARIRTQRSACPPNAVRLETGTPCAITGKCEDCHVPGRMCCNTMITSYNRIPGRIKVILVGEELGF